MKRILPLSSIALDSLLDWATRHHTVTKLYYHCQRCKRGGARSDAPLAKMTGLLMILGIILAVTGIVLSAYGNIGAGPCFSGAFVMYLTGRAWLWCVEHAHHKCPPSW